MSSTETTETTETDEKAQQIADAMEITTAELDAKIYRSIAEVAMPEGNDDPDTQRENVIASVYDDVVGEVAAALVSERGVDLTGTPSDGQTAPDDPDPVEAYGSGTEGVPTSSADDLDEDDAGLYGTGVEY